MALQKELERIKLMAEGSTSPEIQSMLDLLLKKLNAEKKKDKKAKKAVIYSSDEDAESSDNDQPYTSVTAKKKKKPKKPSTAIVEDSSDDSATVETTSTVEKQKSKTISRELKVNLGKLNVNELKKKGKLKDVNVPEKDSPSEDAAGKIYLKLL